MPRRPRLEIEGGLYHVITRGNERRVIFHSDEDHAKFLSLLGGLKERLPFYLYAFCLMSNHVHLLIERRIDAVGRIMHRLLTGYAQYYNRRCRRSGHLLQGRYKAILCQSETYLTQLVRYIHLNPVRANMVIAAEEYRHSSLGGYLGIEPPGIVDVDPVLRRFGTKRKVALDRFAQFMAEGAGLGYIENFYAPENDILGSEEFVDEAIHRIGEPDTAKRLPRPSDGALPREPAGFDRERLVVAVEKLTGVRRVEFCGRQKSARLVAAKEVLIVAGRRLGARVNTLADLTGLDPSTVSRRYDAASRRAVENDATDRLVIQVVSEYESAAR